MKADGVADGAIVAGQLGPRRQVLGGDIVPERNAERAGIRRIRMIEVAPVVPAQHPQVEPGVVRRLGPKEALQRVGHLGQLGPGEHPIDPAVEPPDQLPDRTGSFRNTPMP